MRVVTIKKRLDDSMEVEFEGIKARQELLPLLRFAEKQFSIYLRREALKPRQLADAPLVSPTVKGE